MPRAGFSDCKKIAIIFSKNLWQSKGHKAQLYTLVACLQLHEQEQRNTQRSKLILAGNTPEHGCHRPEWRLGEQVLRQTVWLSGVPASGSRVR